jgi:hypothetical protein
VVDALMVHGPLLWALLRLATAKDARPSPTGFSIPAPLDRRKGATRPCGMGLRPTLPPTCDGPVVGG